jgi:hypothetical protein
MNERILSVKVSAGAKSEKVEEISPGVFRVRTNVAPEKGKANERVRELLAEYLGVPRMSVYLKSGLTSRDKIFVVEE